MAEAVVTMVVAELILATTEWLGKEISLVKGVKAELKNVSFKLQRIRNVLDDAEKRSIKEQSVQDWLENLKDISYEMDDVLDEWKTTISKREIEEVENSIPERKISCSPFFTCYSIKQEGLRHDIAFRVKNINTRLNSIIKQKNDFKLVLKYPIPNRVINSMETIRRTTSIVRESDVYDRDSDRAAILKMLLSEEGRKKEHRIPVISIVGVGGLGKTSLAKLIYNDKKVGEMFRKKVWVCVSDPFDLSNIASEIVEAIDGIRPNTGSKNILLEHLKESISNKKFLLVLDDVWNEDGEIWKEMRDCLEGGAIGSRILVTTRKEKVAKVMGTLPTLLHLLGELSETASWSLFSEIAFADKNENDCNILSEIGRNIIKRCKGLPLAVRVISNLLRFKNTVEEWQHVLDSEIWQLDEVTVELFPHLYLSYNELPLDVKQCFSYCSIYPKDAKIVVDKLIRIWIAQGYVSSTDEGNHMELKGREYFNKLASCSFFQEFEKDKHGEIITCKIHDIVHDFAQYLTRDECITIEKVKSNSCSKKIRHLTLLANTETESLLSVCDVGKLRTFACENGNNKQPSVSLLNSLKSVRVLIMKNCDMDGGLPKELRCLIHLRYLHLSHLRELPESVCELYNLQTLDIKDYGQELKRFPQSIGKLINLRHLFYYHDKLFEDYPKSFEKLTNLRTLEYFQVGKTSGKMEYLKDMNHLRGSLSIFFYDVVEEDAEVDAKKSELKNKKNIKELELNFIRNGFGSEEMLEALQPPPNLQKLEIVSFNGGQLPNWLTNSLINLKVLKLNGGSTCFNLPPLGKLPNLEELEIRDYCTLIYIGREFLGLENSGGLRRAPFTSSICSFPKLVSLTLYGLRECEKWEDLNEEDEDTRIEIMPQLQKLKIRGCKKLRKLPDFIIHKLSSLKTVDIDISGITRATSKFVPNIHAVASRIPSD